ncbi:MAG: ATP-dependent Clp protease ATP-binding subunit ClpX [Candidatus Marinimicrobia bacterium]|nr:ATP-dependent Clp protease ATP-binding subunit ClpX [Candidatus Neomarinimicrobiota bacterium]|tara:strand:+ start:4485 stop:5711 length:1227 start_codon:yes stop_codon:yes gene_type:complete
MKKTDKQKIYCSFCGIHQEDVELLIEGNEVYICNLCLDKASQVINQNNNTFSDDYDSLLKPFEIKNKLDEYIISQEQAKKILSVGVYNHYKRILLNKVNSNHIDKSNILLVGPTGTGKTLLAKTLAQILNVPFTIVDATVLTEAGYVGEDVENILVRLYHDADYDIDKAEKGIIYIDEIDKIARKTSNPSITRDVSGEGVQQSLLKIIEGTIASIPPEGGRKHPEQPLIKINTSNILFICGGTFDGIENLIEKRIKGSSIGFDRFSLNPDNQKDSYLDYVESEDVVQFGFLPELMGRLPIVTSLNYLNKEDLLSILTDPVDSIINQYKQLFKLEDVDLVFSKKSLIEIVNLAHKRKIGARALRSTLEQIMVDIMYEVPSMKNVKKCEITSSTILKNKSPKFTFYKKTA